MTENILTTHPLFRTLRELKGNPRISVLTEPLFGIPFNLFNPFFSVYMLALGMTDQQIGGLASLGLVVQIFTALLSGAIVDKFGRRLTLFINDMLCWSVPCLIWAFAQDLRYFIAAALMNSLWRISHTAWTCLMIEDAEERHLVHIWTWVTIFGVCSAFFAPLGGWFVERYGLVAAMRGIFIFGFVILTLKFILLYRYSHETERGLQRKEETRGIGLVSLLGQYRGVFAQLLRSKTLLSAMLLMLIISIYQTVSGSFWGVLFTSKLGFSDSQISLYAALRSIVMTLSFFLLGPRLTNVLNFRPPLWAGFGAFFLSQALLVFMPPQATLLLSVSVLLEALASALVNPMVESLLALALETKERARTSAMVYLALILFTSPFGWIAGQLSAVDRALPFAFNMGLFVVGAALVWLVTRSGSSLADS